MSTTWYTSDLHIGHRLVAGLRGFETPAEHDAALATYWDDVVGPGDAVWVLGDISVGGKRAELAALDWVSRRPGTKHLVAGNHDSCHPMRSRAHIWQRIYLSVFESVQQSAMHRLDGERVLLSHFPYAGDPDGDHTSENRFEEWRLPATGDNAHRALLHGHTHDSICVRGRQVHVGLDAHDLRPVAVARVQMLLGSNPPG